MNRPHYGSYWRLYLAEVPAAARAFAPPQFPKVQQALQAAGIPVANVDPSIAKLTGADLAMYQALVGRVALDGASCFSSETALAACTWLDSQPAIEMHLGLNALHKTDITVTCPFVSYAGNPVPNP
jgi:hypothetical protein